MTSRQAAMRSRKEVAFNRKKKVTFVAPLEEVLLVFRCPITKMKQYLVRYKPTTEEQDNLSRNTLNEYRSRVKAEPEGTAPKDFEEFAPRAKYLAVAMHNYFHRLEFLFAGECENPADTDFHKQSGQVYEIEGVDRLERVNSRKPGKEFEVVNQYRVHWAPVLMDEQQMESGYMQQLIEFESRRLEGIAGLELTAAEAEQFLESYRNPVIARLQRLTSGQTKEYIREKVVRENSANLKKAQRKRKLVLC